MDVQTRNDFSLTAPTLPKGGGAIQSVGHGWGAVGVTGSASVAVPLPASAGRTLAPSLVLAYASQGGRTAFGQGWNVEVPSIARRSSKGVPAYEDNDEFVGPNGDVLVPERDDQGNLLPRKVDTFRGVALGGTYEVQRYFLRVEGSGWRIESWRGADWFWMAHAPDGSVHLYGKTARLAASDGSGRIASWCLEESVAANGDKMRYEYAREDGAGVPDAWMDRDHGTQLYLRRVLYGNAQGGLKPDLLQADAGTRWLFELLLDYGERNVDFDGTPSYEPAQPWTVRQDPFSSFAFGFEIRTLRLCRQVLMFHRFPELGEDPVLVRRLLLEYDESEYLTTLVAAHEIAYGADGTAAYGPPMAFRHTPFASPDTAAFKPFDAMPGLNDGSRYQLVDLYGEGLAGVLHTGPGGWYYREPIRAAQGGDEVAYDTWRLLPKRPAADDRSALADLTGDGKLDLVVARPGSGGFFTLSPDREWSTFVPFAALPTEFTSAQGQLVDMRGDGLSDFALIGTRSVRWYANARAEGFDPPVEVPHDLDRLPGEGDNRSVLVAFSDLLGSGQQHLVRIRHDEVSVWPNLGRGRFGARLTFAALPFDATEFDASRVRLADLDGSGATDLIYLRSDEALVFMNRSGHGFAEPLSVAWPAGVRYDRLCEVSTADLQGLGCSSLVLTVPHMRPRHWRCDFAAIKPYMLDTTNNNMGALGEVVYRSSAQEWLDEKAEAREEGARPSASELPFPLQVVTVQRLTDEITKQTLSQRYRYRRGYYDGHEREFRGFGLLLQYDTEVPADDAVPEDGFTAPVLTRTWFHTGRPQRPEDDAFSARDPDLPPLGPSLYARFDTTSGEDVVEASWSDDMVRQMGRALSGSVMRVEVYGLDDPMQPPYAVSQFRYLVRVVREPTAEERHAVLWPFTLESRECRYERLTGDPRISHTLNLRRDAYGASTHAMEVHYARRKGESPFDDEYERRWWEDSRDTAQESYYIAESMDEWIHLDEDPPWWRLNLPYRSRANAMVLLDTALRPEDIGYERFIAEDGPVGAGLPRTLAQLSVQRYQGSADGEASFEALPDYTETAELDETALQAYADVMTPAELEAKLVEVGYHRMSSFMPTDQAVLWSVQQGFATFAPIEAFRQVLAHRLTRELGETTAEYDAHALLVTRVVLPDGCSTEAEYDYRTLLPRRITDPNRNVQEATYDAFGRVTATSFHGTEMGVPTGFAPIADYVRPFDLPDEALADPEAAIQGAATTCFYAPMAWMAARRPPHAAVLQADRYPGDPERQIRRSIADSDGFGRILQQKQLTEPGEAYIASADGGLELDGEGQPVKGLADPRWRVSERVEYNNKGLPVRTYRPYFANTHHYIHDEAFRQFGYCDRQYYDPLGRPTVTRTAAGWMRRQTYWPWYTVAEDENDTAEEVLDL